MPDEEKKVPAKVAPPPAPAPAPAPPCKPVEEWARAKGHVAMPRAPIAKPGMKTGPAPAPVLDWRFRAAEALHAWKAKAHNAGAPVELTEKEYDDAIAAALAVEIH